MSTTTNTMSTTGNASTITYTMEKPTRPDEDGSAGVAAMVPAVPDRGDGGMLLDVPT